MSPRRWQYQKSLSLRGHILVPMRKTSYLIYILQKNVKLQIVVMGLGVELV